MVFEIPLSNTIPQKEIVSSGNPKLVLGLLEQKALSPYVCVAFEGL